MGVEELSDPAQWAHLDGSLVYPMCVDGHHVLITEDGVTLLLPRSMHVNLPGRVGIDAGTSGIHINTGGLSGEDIAKISRWGERLQSTDVIDAIRRNIDKALRVISNPESYTPDG